MKHPAKFSEDILDVAYDLLAADSIDPQRVLDPFAGTGRVHELGERSTMIETFGVEIEPEWASLHPRTIVGDALALPYPDGWFDAIVTSPAYGNRMADGQEPNEKCRACDGTGFKDGDFKEYPIIGLNTGKECPKCRGKGHNKYKRITYRHYLGRKLHQNNAGGLQWGDKYRAFHERSWAEAVRVLRPGGKFILNCKDHVRKGFIQHVTDWHLQCLEGLGLQLERRIAVAAPGMRMGDNGQVRVDHEDMVLLVKP